MDVTGEMATLIRKYDWTATSLGSMTEWPACLRAAVDLMLPAEAQIVMFAGPEFVALYNDSYAPTIGKKHPAALGRPAREHWSELWSDLGPLLEEVRATGRTISAKDRPFYIERSGRPETVYFDISYSAIRDESGIVHAVFCIVNETTDRILAQNALKQSEGRLRALFGQAMSGIALTDLAGRFIMVNDRYCEILGYAESELLTMRIRDVTHPDDLPAQAASFQTLIRDGKNFSLEKRSLRKSGEVVWVSSSVGAIRDELGRISQTSEIVTDISERRRSETLQRQLAAIIESSNDAILSSDLDMRITSWNQGAERLYGYSAAEMIGKSVTILVPEDRPDEEPAIIERIRKGDPVAPHETRRVCKDGRSVDVSLMVSPIRDEHGRIVGASKIAHDISERKNAERLRQLLIGELQHRVKNILAMVQAIARQTFGSSEESAAQAFSARLLALSKAHDLVTRETWEGAYLSAVVNEVVAPYPAERFEIEGPPLVLSPRSVLAISLALHELTTNAAKYGALSVPSGRVSIRWANRLDEVQCCELRWEETGGPAVKPPTRRGFGTRLIETALSAELHGHVEIVYRPEGVVCEVRAPMGSGWETHP